jgi:CRISPR-associated protein Csb2
MVRHAASLAAKAAGRPNDWIASFVLGHGDGPGAQARSDQRFGYLPLPSITPRKVEAVRRVLLAEPAGGAGEHVRWAMRALSGADLLLDGTPVGLLALEPLSDPVVRNYLTRAVTWSTVTPIVLPGHDDAGPDLVRRRRERARSAEDRQRVSAKAAGRTERLLRKALRQAGIPPALAEHCDLDWRPVGYRAGVAPARHYAVPPYLDRLPRYHVRIGWRTAGGEPAPVAGPLAVGAGRYCGFGLFAAEP